MTQELPLARGTRVLLDTNTVLALWLFEDPALNALRAAIAGQRFVLIAREDCLEELRRTLRYAQFKADEARQQSVLEAYRGEVEIIDSAEDCSALPRCRDTDDQKFLETAWTGAAQLLVSRDKAVLRSGRHRVFKARFATLTPETLNHALLQLAESVESVSPVSGITGGV